MSTKLAIPSILLVAFNAPLGAPVMSPPGDPSGALSRSTRNVMSEFYMGDAPVPYSAILRTHNRPPLAAADFPSWRVPHPRDIIVLGVRNAASVMLSAWFVRFDCAPHHLVRLPWGVAHELSAVIADAVELHRSALYKLFPECYFSSTTDDFSALATGRFLRKARLVGRAARARRPPLHFPTPPCMRDTPVDSVCAICLEGGGTLVKNCCVPVCLDCHVGRMRTLCPVCDRNVLNGSHTCMCCMEAVPFSEHGNQCVSCPSQTLCARCWCDFGECVACDPTAGVLL